MSDADTLDKIAAALALPAQPSSDFDLNPDVVLPVGRKLHPAAVLVPIIQRSYGLMLVLTKRAAALRHHPGQIAFPGGKMDAADADLTATALREAHEEIGLHPSEVEVIGTLAPHETVTAFCVTPHVALITPTRDWQVDPGEVDEVFEIPLAHVLHPQNYRNETRIWYGKPRRYLVVPYGPYYIWGATARMLHGLADRLQP